MSIGNIANTGMKSSMSEMEVISNNISNANTIGFKKSYVNFSDVYAAGSASNAQPGLGVSISSIRQDFQRGGVDMTGGSLDMMIGNDSFFMMKDPSSGQFCYTRAGHFSPDPEGYVINDYGQRLQGFPANNGVILAGSSTSDLKIDTTPMPASATSNVKNAINLDSNGVIPTGVFDDTDTSTYNYRTDTQIVDSLGNPNTLSMFYIKTADNAWTVQVEVNGTAVGTGAVTFTSGGALDTTTGLDSLSFNPTSGAKAPQTFGINLKGSTQVASSYDPGHPTKDGYSAGAFAGYDVDSNGYLNLHYSNNEKRTVGQVALANFSAPDGLSSVGNMSWTQTSKSGNPTIAQSNSMGKIISGSLELSNVDLTDEMVNLIGAQHNFQANAQVEQVYNEVMQTVIKL